MSNLPGGDFHDLNDMARHFHSRHNREGRRNELPLIVMGISSIGIGCSILWDVWVRTRAGKPGHGQGR